MFCPKCGEENPDTPQFCLKCGMKLPITSPAQQSTVKLEGLQNNPMVDWVYGVLTACALTYGIQWVIFADVYYFLFYQKYGFDFVSHVPSSDVILIPAMFIGGFVALAIANFLFKKIDSKFNKYFFLICGIIIGFYIGIMEINYVIEIVNYW